VIDVMAREVTEKRTCDHCGASIYRDSGAWIGARIDFSRCIAGMSEILSDNQSFDLCLVCAKDFLRFVKGNVE
jgi:hypothetical protein